MPKKNGKKKGTEPKEPRIERTEIAVRIMDELEKQGKVGPATGKGPREILFDLSKP